MNNSTRLLSIAALALAAQGAFAKDMPVDPAQFRSAPSTLTRAEVREAAIQAMKSGQIGQGESAEVARPAPNAAADGTVSRAQVASEAREANRLGLSSGGESGGALFDASALRSAGAARTTQH